MNPVRTADIGISGILITELRKLILELDTTSPSTIQIAVLSNRLKEILIKAREASC